MNFINFDLLSVTINNIICSDVVGSYNLTYELIKNESFTRLIKFKVGEEQLRLFFKKILLTN